MECICLPHIREAILEKLIHMMHFLTQLLQIIESSWTFLILHNFWAWCKVCLPSFGILYYNYSWQFKKYCYFFSVFDVHFIFLWKLLFYCTNSCRSFLVLFLCLMTYQPYIILKPSFRSTVVGLFLNIASSTESSKRYIVVKLKGRPRRLLSLMSQPGFVIQRDNEWHAVYAGGTADVYMNPATVHSWIKN